MPQPLVEPVAGLTAGHMPPGVVVAAGTEPAVVVVVVVAIESLELGLGLASTDAAAADAVAVRTAVGVRQPIRMTVDHWDRASKTLVPALLAVDAGPRHLTASVVPGSLRCQSRGGDLGLRTKRPRRLDACRLVADDSLAYCNVAGLSCEPVERPGLMGTLLDRSLLSAWMEQVCLKKLASLQLPAGQALAPLLSVVLLLPRLCLE